MNILLDTHVLLWLMVDDNRLSDKARAVYLERRNRLFFSMGSFWEISIKIGLGKLELAKEWPDIISKELTRNAIQWLHIEPEHCVEQSRLPFHHRDPFDRLLIAQAKAGGLHILSSDRHFARYDIDTIW